VKLTAQPARTSGWGGALKIELPEDVGTPFATSPEKAQQSIIAT
jgi:hypothetical protein